MIDYTPKEKKQTFQKFATKSVKLTNDSPVKSGYTPRQTTYYPSKVTDGGSTFKYKSLKYTGDKMLGVTILHKSCLQPVFSQDAAKDAASMRR